MLRGYLAKNCQECVVFTAPTHTIFTPFLIYNCNFSSILYSRFINFALSCFNIENDNLRVIPHVASLFPKHYFCKNLYIACKDFQLPLASPFVNV